MHPATQVYAEIGAAYNARGTYEYNGKTYDFGAKTGNVEFIMGGHEHYDKSGYINGIAYVMSAAAKDNHYEVVLVDYDERTIKTLCLGCGGERTVSLDEQ